MSNIKTLYFGFSGKIGSGKNYIAEQVFLPILISKLKNNYPDHLIVPMFYSFGDHLKVECLCRQSYDKLSSETGYENFFCEKTQETRDMLQQYGTENGRSRYHENIWIRAIDSWIMIQQNRLQFIGYNVIAIVIITDVRFCNELEYVKSKSGIIFRVNAQNRTLNKLQKESNCDPIIIDKIANHASEISLDDYKFEHIINNDYDIQMKNIVDYIENVVNNI